MELRVLWVEHVRVADAAFLGLLFVRVDQFLTLVINLTVAHDVCQAVLCIVFATVRDEPARAFRQTFDDKHQANGVYLHADNGYPPSPLIELAQRDSDGQIDGESHVETEDVALEFLGESFTTGAIGTEFGTVDGHDAVDTADTETHDDTSYVHDRKSAFVETETGDEHDEVAQACHGETAEHGWFPTALVCYQGEYDSSDSAAYVEAVSLCTFILHCTSKSGSCRERAGRCRQIGCKTTYQGSRQRQ